METNNLEVEDTETMQHMIFLVILKITISHSHSTLLTSILSFRTSSKHHLSRSLILRHRVLKMITESSALLAI
jgi:hypothetical protein